LYGRKTHQIAGAGLEADRKHRGNPEPISSIMRKVAIIKDIHLQREKIFAI
jgi:hypothetical protein